MPKERPTLSTNDCLNYSKNLEATAHEILHILDSVCIQVS